MSAVAHPSAAWWRPERPAAPFRARETDEGGRLPLAALILFTGILLLAPQSWLPALAPLRLGMLAAGLAIAAHLADRFVRGRPLATASREIVLAALLAGWAVVTLPFSYWPAGSLGFLLEIFLKAITVFWLIGEVVGTVSRLAALAWSLNLMALPLAVTALRNWAQGVFVPQGVAADVKRIAGYEAPLTGNPNDLALMLNLIFPLGLALFVSTRRPAARLLLGVLLFLDVVAILSTFSRAGFLTLAVSMALFGWRMHQRGRLPWALVALVAVALPLAPSGYLAHMGTITDIQADPTGSAQERWDLLVTAARYVAAHPVVGTGIGMNILAMNDLRGEAWREVHNAYLEYAVELGVPGLALFLALFAGCLRHSSRARRSALGDPAGFRLARLAEGVQVSLIAYGVAALFHPLAYHFHFYYIAGMALGLRAAAARSAAARFAPQPNPSRRRS
ncbi:MAG TPA: O-antigen ligase family protein [Candidatus Polarisedimenticolia bacterium]|nr:O-antigen ligase family protein [Candidatus Polarisedimenticolia bacterium]